MALTLLSHYTKSLTFWSKNVEKITFAGVQCYTTKGRLSNISDIYQNLFNFGTKQEGFENYEDPNLTVNRKFFEIGIAYLRQWLGKVFNGAVKTLNDGDQFDKDESKDVEINDKNQEMRQQLRKQTQHETEYRRMDAKIREIVEFCKEHRMATNYLYEDIKRIKSQRKIMDDFRKIVTILENPRNKDIKEQVLEYYQGVWFKKNNP